MANDRPPPMTRERSRADLGRPFRRQLRVTGCREDGLPATDGQPLTADAPLQRGEMAKSAMQTFRRLAWATANSAASLIRTPQCPL